MAHLRIAHLFFYTGIRLGARRLFECVGDICKTFELCWGYVRNPRIVYWRCMYQTLHKGAPNKTKQSLLVLNKTKQNKTKQNKTKSCGTKQNKTKSQVFCSKKTFS